MFIGIVQYSATSQTTHEANILSIVVSLLVVIFVKSHLSDNRLFPRAENNFLCIYRV